MGSGLGALEISTSVAAFDLFVAREWRGSARIVDNREEAFLTISAAHWIGLFAGPSNRKICF
jgi:hypothetical protein